MTRSRRRKLMKQQANTSAWVLRRSIPVASALLAGLPAAYGQEAPANANAAPLAGGGGLEEVVVTAQKRVENLQDVPISVQVLDTTKLDQLNITGIDSYVKFSPSVAYVRGEGQGGNGQPGESHIYMRGVVSGGTNHSGSQPSVGEYLDEQPVTTIVGNVDVHIYDIQRIEVLEGPQGTLYGASSQSGTVRIITNKPDPTKFSGSVDLQANQIINHGSGYELEGYVNIPITSSMAVRLVGWTEHVGGYISNVAGTNAGACITNGVRTFPSWAGAPITGSCLPAAGVPIGAGAITNAPWAKLNYNPVNTTGGRAALRWNINDNWTITPSVMAQSTTTRGFFGYDPVVGDLQLVHYAPEYSSDSWQQTSLTVEGKISNFDLVYSTGFFKRTTHSLADYSDYSEFYDSVSGYGQFWLGNGNGCVAGGTVCGVGTPIMPQEIVNSRSKFQKWSHELRVSTPSDLPVRAQLGFFVQRQYHGIFEQYMMPGYGATNVRGFVNVPPNPAGFADSLSIPTLPNTVWLTDESRVDRDQAAFLQADWDITKKLTATAGIRYFKYDNTLDGFYGYSLNFDNFFGGPGMAACFAGAWVDFTPCTNLAKRNSGHGTVPRLNLTYKFTPDVMAYITYSKGFRPGGVNRTAAAGIPPYSADYLKNYELGWKTQWFNHSLRWNGALFQEDWNDFQYSFLGPNSVTIIENAASARIRGIESSIEWLPTTGLFTSGSFQLLDPVTTAPICKSATVACPGGILPNGKPNPLYAPAGTNLPTAPKFKGTVTVRYELPEVAGLSPFVQGAWVYQSQAGVGLRQDQAKVVGNTPAYGLVDFTVGRHATRRVSRSTSRTPSTAEHSCRASRSRIRPSIRRSTSSPCSRARWV